MAGPNCNSPQSAAPSAPPRAASWRQGCRPARPGRRPLRAGVDGAPLWGSPRRSQGPRRPPAARRRWDRRAGRRAPPGCRSARASERLRRSTRSTASSPPSPANGSLLGKGCSRCSSRTPRRLRPCTPSRRLCSPPTPLACDSSSRRCMSWSMPPIPANCPRRSSRGKAARCKPPSASSLLRKALHSPPAPRLQCDSVCAGRRRTSRCSRTRSTRSRRSRRRTARCCTPGLPARGRCTRGRRTAPPSPYSSSCGAFRCRIPSSSPSNHPNRSTRNSEGTCATRTPSSRRRRAGRTCC
mmetsp:Transcript_58710/g.169904  ORF Transcript_58710/g.169904 Transcript_58710/m.169904 type:complete len:297 (-) Transcript_58710:660-1550(-)